MRALKSAEKDETIWGKRRKIKKPWPTRKKSGLNMKKKFYAKFWQSRLRRNSNLKKLLVFFYIFLFVQAKVIFFSTFMIHDSFNILQPTFCVDC